MSAKHWSAEWFADGIEVPEPFYSDDRVAIYCGDSFLMKTKPGAYDLLVTDPPYGMKFRSNHRIIKHAEIANDDALPVEFVMEAVRGAARASYVFMRWDNLHEMPKPKSCLAWVKDNWSMGDLEHEHGRQWEACLFYPAEKHEFRKRIPDVVTAPRTGNSLHPTQKPVPLIGKLLDANVCGSVFDPFMGSGTTLVAAAERGIRAVGIELNRDYCQIAADRLKQGFLL